MTAKRDAAEAALEPFFAAARATEPPPSLALLSAILADAADAGAARLPAPRPARRSAWRRLRGLAEPLGGWRGLAALGACAAIGFWVGVAGGVSIEGGSVWTGSTPAEASADPVGAFFDLASAEQ